MNERVPCRSCGSSRLHQVIDLGMQPLANNLLREEDLKKEEPHFPLEVWVCGDCWLMQISHVVPPVDLFSQYLYFSSFSDQLLAHSRTAVLKHIEQKQLGSGSFVVEVASNDGYLLKNFVEAGIPCLGFEPAANIAEVAQGKGIETRVEFFSETSAAALREERGGADLILGNNVFAHVPDTNGFVAGLAALLKADGWAVLEFPYGVEMIDKVEFDTIYHEHVFYFTLLPLLPLFARHGLEVFHVEHLSIHGGTLRLYAARTGVKPVTESVTDTVAKEKSIGVDGLEYYERFGARADKVRADLIQHLETAAAKGLKIAGYGASAKGSTLLNYVGGAARSLEFIADRSTYKQGLFSPGLHLPIVAAEELERRQPDEAVLLTWNFAEEIMRQQDAYRKKGGRFVIPLPELRLA